MGKVKEESSVFNFQPFSRTKSILHNPYEVLDPVYVCCVTQTLAAILLQLVPLSGLYIWWAGTG